MKNIGAAQLRGCAGCTWADPEKGQGVQLPPPPRKITKNYGFLAKVSNGAKIRNRYNQVPHLTQDTTGPESLKNHKATKPAFNVWPSSARQRNAI